MLSSFYNKVLYLEEAIVEVVVVDKVVDKIIKIYLIKKL